ncbi:unnamed protein product [Lactuca virosa]|uniref:Uncharacterized protein n=1 Tax=Lactuca virosa TaxID=75947 RepID=A0AAU9NJJ9_9ASTR|nr:unnamed protein product [Lactuca virosa]
MKASLKNVTFQHDKHKNLLIVMNSDFFLTATFVTRKRQATTIRSFHISKKTPPSITTPISTVSESPVSPGWLNNKHNHESAHKFCTPHDRLRS